MSITLPPEDSLPEFNHIAMSEVEAVFKDALKHCLGQYTGETKKEMVKVLLGLGLTTNIHAAFMPEGLKALVGTVFGESMVRDFMMLLTASFLSRYGSATADYPVLANTLANALTVEPVGDVGSKYDLMPSAYSSRLPDREEIFNHLIANKWLITYSLCVLYVNSSTLSEMS